MLTFPNSKINLGLHIVDRRDDGFHELQTLFYPLTLKDALEIIPAPDNKTTFTSSGIDIPDDGAKNLCEKAWDLLHQHHAIPAVKIHLHKNIPIGAGLGGGSADAVYTLLLLNDLFSLNLSPRQLMAHAARLGSDCAFFILNTPCMATGRGEILTPFAVNLKGYELLLVKPPVHVSTARAYAGVKPLPPRHILPEVLTLSPEHWKDKLVNDFEESIFPDFPQIAHIKTQLYHAGALYACMSGSGSSVFGIFKENTLPEKIKELEGCFVWREVL